MSRNYGVPIDIRAGHEALTGLAHSQYDRVLSAQEELGGLPPIDERFEYMPFAASVLEDPRKKQIARGLGELGLIMITPSDVNRMHGNEQSHYAAALLDYKTNLDGRANVFKTEGTEEADWFKQAFPNADATWSYNYGEELHHLSDKIAISNLYSVIKSIREADPKAVKRAHDLQRSAGPAGRVILHRRESTHKVTPVRQSRRAA